MEVMSGWLSSVPAMVPWETGKKQACGHDPMLVPYQLCDRGMFPFPGFSALLCYTGRLDLTLSLDKHAFPQGARCYSQALEIHLWKR